MPSVPIYPPSRTSSNRPASSSYPQTIHTPSGLALLEIQGSINSTLPPSNGAATSIGKLVFPLYDAHNGADDTSWQKRVYLYVGQHQRLTGEVKKLAKPIAILRRRQRQSYTADGDADAEEMEIAEIVKYKVLFASRPEPVGGGVGNG